MLSHKHIRTANDNSPSLNFLKRAFLNDAAESTEQAHASDPAAQSSNEASAQAQTNQADKPQTVKSLRITQILWLASILSVIAAMLFSAPIEVQALSLIALLWMSLWSSYVFADHKLPRLKEIAVLSTMACLLSVFALVANFLSLSISPMDGAILGALGSLVIAGVMKSRIALLCSISASLIWAILTPHGTGSTAPLLFVFPFIALAQTYVGTKINSGLTISLSIFTGYYWLAWLLTNMWSAGNMPITFGAAALTVIGMAQHRAGKAAEDKRMSGSILHIYAGWIAAVTGAVVFQLFWLDSNILSSSTASISADALQNWKFLVMACIAIIFVSGIIRYKYSQITLLGIVLVTLASALIPAMLWIPDWPVSILESLAGMKAMPTFGLIIGAAIVASALGIILNGLRRKSNIMIALGLLALFSQAFLLLNPALVTLDNSVVFFTSLLIAMTIGASIAGNSVAHQAPPPRLKPNEI